MTKKAATPKPTAAYIRISDKDQNSAGQKEVVTNWLLANGFDLTMVEFYEDVESGVKFTRKALDRLQRDIFSGIVKTVVVFKVDRLARRLVEGINLLQDWCDKGVRVISVTQQIDVSGAMGRMVAALLLGFAEIEYEYRKERQAAGIVVAKREGVYKGRKPGTTKGSPERVKELAAKGLKPVEIVEATGLSLASIYRYLAV